MLEIAVFSDYCPGWMGARRDLLRRSLDKRQRGPVLDRARENAAM